MRGKFLVAATMAGAGLLPMPALAQGADEGVNPISAIQNAADPKSVVQIEPAVEVTQQQVAQNTTANSPQTVQVGAAAATTQVAQASDVPVEQVIVSGRAEQQIGVAAAASEGSV